MIPPKTKRERERAHSLALDGGYFPTDPDLAGVFEMSNDRRMFADPLFDECYKIGKAMRDMTEANKITDKA